MPFVFLGVPEKTCHGKKGVTEDCNNLYLVPIKCKFNDTYHCHRK